MSRPLSIRKWWRPRDGGGATHPDLDDERSDRSDHDVVRAHFTSLEEAEACAAVKKPRTAALRAETKTAWDE